MPAGFHSLKIAQLKRETKDAVSIQFEIPENLISEFQYKAGQYLTFSISINNEEVRRSYSVCSSPITDVFPTIAVKEVPGGKMSTHLNRNIKEGDSVFVMPPKGSFVVEPDSAATKNYFLFGGGSGITPLLSILRTILLSEPNSKIFLFYANRDKESIIFESDIASIAAANSERIEVIHSLDNPHEGWLGESGYLTEEKVSNLIRTKLGLNYPTTEYFTCGPGPMMDVVVSGLKSAGVSNERIHTEYFTAAVKTETITETAVEQEVDEEIKERTIFVEVFGERKEVTVKPEETILIAAQDAGLDPPYSCTVGVCTTCRARVKTGKASMDEREGLSDSEINEGFILTCQAHPLTDDLDIIFE